MRNASGGRLLAVYDGPGRGRYNALKAEIMEFRTKLVVTRRNKRAIVAYIGLGIAASSLLLLLVPSLNDYIPYVFGIGIAVVVIGAFIARGDLMDYGLSEDELVVSPAGISVGSVHYPMKLISDMDFNVEAYEGLYVNDGAMISGSKSDGMTNQLIFKSGGAKITCGFFLSSPQHVQLLGVVFNEFYQLRIPFIERNRHTQTFMFQRLTERDLEEFKKRYNS